MQTPEYSRFEVKIINKPFYAENGSSYPNTATISFFDKKNHNIETIDYGHLPTKEIYNQIDENNALSLDYCYVKNFSLTAYRRTRILDKKETVCLKSITAKHTFFDSDFTIDFSHLELDQGDIDFSNTHFARGILDFSHCNFGDGNINFNSITSHSETVDFANSIFGKGEVIFKNARFFDGNIDFQYTDFGEGDLNFTNTDFGNGNVTFINTNFGVGKAIFKVARFGKGEVDFHYSKFGNGDISFERVDFGDGYVNFKNVEFGKGKVNFNRSVFGNGSKSFEGCTSTGRMTFKKASLGNGDLNFELMEFENSELNLEKAELGNGAISFLNSQFSILDLSGCQINDYLDLRVQNCPYLNISNTIVRDIIDFKPFDFKVNIGTLNIFGMRLLGTIYIDWKTNDVQRLIQSQNNTNFEQKADQFLTLKESFNKSGQYNDEDEAYVWFKRYEAIAKHKAKTNKNLAGKIIHTPIYAFEKLIFDYAGLYATNPMRVLLSMIVTLAIFGFIYAFVLSTNMGGIVSGLGDKHDLLGLFGRSFYHSGITFFTIGYGDFYPMGAIRWLSNLEGFVGVFLMSYFTVAFVRKILR